MGGCGGLGREAHRGARAVGAAGAARQKSADERNHRAKAHKARRSWEKQVRKAEHLGYVDSPRRREKSVDAESPALSARARGDSADGSARGLN